MSEQAEQLKKRSMIFALDVCRLIKSLPYHEPGPTVRRQLARSSTSMAFNYRAACRARSHAEFTAKMEEAMELVAIFSATYGTARANQHE